MKTEGKESHLTCGVYAHAHRVLSTPRVVSSYLVIFANLLTMLQFSMTNYGFGGKCHYSVYLFPSPMITIYYVHTNCKRYRKKTVDNF